MTYHEITIETNETGVDIVANRLNDLGIDAFEILGGELPKQGDWDYIDEALIAKMQTGFAIRVYLEDNTHYPLLLTQIKNSIKQLVGDYGTLNISIVARDDNEWKDVWKTYFKPFKAGKQIVICPQWESYTKNKNEIVVTIDPGAAFGSGLHETTKMCIMALEKAVTQSTHVIDIGCGSGILGIAALKLGARHVLALDRSTTSVAVAKDNAKQNAVQMTVQEADLLTGVNKQQADIVVANIIADVIIRLNNDVKTFLKPNGIYITSGIIAERLTDVLESLHQQAFEVLDVQEMGEWRAITATPKQV